MTIAPLVVVVDDDAGLIVAIDGLLRSHGYRVLTCCGVGEYLASDKARTAVCVITDLRMPGGMDGIDLLEHVARPCRVILMSAFMDDAARARAVRAGVWCILDKPFTEEELISQIRAVIVSHGAPPAC